MAKGPENDALQQDRLAGTILIDGNRYSAYLIDTGYNDADLTNDGIAIDLNRDGKIGREESSKETHVIEGKRYTFDIAW